MLHSVEDQRRTFEALAAHLAARPRLQRAAASLARTFKPTVADALERAGDLARRLYVAQLPELAMPVCQLLRAIPFTGNFNHWTWVEYALALEWRLHTEAGQPGPAQGCLAVIEAANAAGSPDDRDTKAAARHNRLDGALLHAETIARAEQEGDQATATVWCHLEVGELLYMLALGGSARWPRAALEEQLATTLRALRV